MSGTVWLVENRAHKSFHRCTLLMLLLWLSGLLGVKGQSTDWQVQADDWNTASNWSNGVPDSLTSATIDNGGITFVLGSAGASSVAVGFFGDGTVIVNGASSTLTTPGYIQACAFGTGRLTVENGGAVRVDGYLQMGLLPGSDGTTMVTGTGSSLVVLGDIVAGGSGTGRLAITNGGVATGGGNVEIGFESGGNGTILVSGSGSILTSDHVLYVGYLGTGSLTVADGAIVQVGGGAGLLIVGSQPGSIGTLNIGDGNAAGTVRAREITGGDGLARVNFNESDQNYIFSISLTGSLTVAQNGSGKTLPWTLLLVDLERLISILRRFT
jgi:T5SS/PEP-CTERM-associated repeat protein